MSTFAINCLEATDMSVNCTEEGDARAALARALVDHCGGAATSDVLLREAVVELQEDVYFATSPMHRTAEQTTPEAVLAAEVALSTDGSTEKREPSPAQRLKELLLLALHHLLEAREIFLCGDRYLASNSLCRL